MTLEELKKSEHEMLYLSNTFIQLYFYCMNLTKDMKDAITHLANAMNLGDLPRGYKLFFKTSVFSNSDDDTTEVISAQLEKAFSEVTVFENEVSNKWNACL